MTTKPNKSTWILSACEWIGPAILGAALHYLAGMQDQLEAMNRTMAAISVSVSELETRVSHLEGYSK